jgi:hypothetical protein
MASNPPTPGNLTCGHCGFVNEAERVYCHSCGSKLDRSLLPRAEDSEEHSPEKARKRISKITNPKSGISVLREVKTFFQVEIGAAVVAVLFVMGLKPDGVPEVKKESMQRMINSDMMEALESPQPRSISFTQDEVNQHLKKTVKTRDALVPGVDAERTYAVFTPGVIRMGTEYSLWGYYSIFAEIQFRVEIKDGKFSTPIIGGNVGRLAVDPRLMEYGNWLFSDTWDTLKRERGEMDKMSRVDVKEGGILLVTKGVGR